MFDIPLFSLCNLGKRRRGRLVNRIENIRRLQEITEAECNHELLLTTRNLQELGASLIPYTIPVVPPSLPVELIEGEHFIIVDLLKLNPSSSSQVVSS